jgi:hypothetical protein
MRGTLPDACSPCHPGSLDGREKAVVSTGDDAQGGARTMAWDAVERLLEEMIVQQERKVLALARRLVPHVTPEDLRNAQDFAPLVASADFNYEDGILAGLQAALMAVRAARRGGENAS